MGSNLFRTITIQDPDIPTQILGRSCHTLFFPCQIQVFLGKTHLQCVLFPCFRLPTPATAPSSKPPLPWTTQAGVWWGVTWCPINSHSLLECLSNFSRFFQTQKVAFSAKVANALGAQLFTCSKDDGFVAADLSGPLIAGRPLCMIGWQHELLIHENSRRATFSSMFQLLLTHEPKIVGTKPCTFQGALHRMSSLECQCGFTSKGHMVRLFLTKLVCHSDFVRVFGMSLLLHGAYRSDLNPSSQMLAVIA